MIPKLFAVLFFLFFYISCFESFRVCKHSSFQIYNKGGSLSKRAIIKKHVVDSSSEAQTKRKARKPRGYWTLENLEKEIVLFWAGFNIKSDMIPNEGILQHFQRHDLRHAIYRFGGQKFIGDCLGIPHMPGAWKVAMKTKELQQLISHGAIKEKGVVGPRGGATPMIKESMNKRKRRKREDLLPSNSSLQPVIPLESFPGENRKKKSLYWTSPQSFRNELFAFTKSYMEQMGQPSTWMPRLQHFRLHGRDDLVAAISRYGGYDAVAYRYALVPYKEWIQFESTYLLARDLLDYLIQWNDSTEFMPSEKEMQENGFQDLNYRLSRMGRKITARRFGLKIVGRFASYNDYINFGDFTLEFAVELLEYIKSVHYKIEIGSQHLDVIGELSVIKMPTIDELIDDSREDLVEQIQAYGGFESVARRLHLEYDDEFLTEEESRINLYLQDCNDESDDDDDFLKEEESIMNSYLQKASGDDEGN